MNAAALQRLSRPPETTPDAREAAAQENDAKREAEAVSGASPATLAGPDQGALARLQESGSVGTRVNVVPASNDTAGTVQRASQEVSRAYAEGQPSAAEMRAASEAYRAEAAASEQMAVQQQRQGGVRTTEVLA
jgi:hypothetical protein